ncbi:class I SAM-dependent methyltransferase [Allobranchiibius sp. GilTou38]|uniref:methyltransferase domain-containing protein n=1 Tax=Allobranchiibius sp. GilTou38 TaxID=2815210 RepID=UPI001AA1CFA2|nr:class I SAM-dependent methyltransferase [Allobranchiibius sp. GilTou38]
MTRQDDAPVDGGVPGSYQPGYFETRLAPNPARSDIWRHLGAYLQRWIAPSSDVLELGAGWCDFSNAITAKRVVAMDLDDTVERNAARQVQAVVGDCTDLSRFEDASFDVVFASNLLEHLERAATNALVDGVQRILRPGGRLILMQPNFRLAPRRYFDDYTHVAIFTDQSLSDYLTSRGMQVEVVKPRFMPLTMKSSGARLSFLVPWYLASPIKPLAGQMLVVASRPKE